MFKIYNLNYNEVSLPLDRLGFGVDVDKDYGFEINIGPVIYENIYTQSNYADKLVKRYPKNRTVSIVMLVEGMDETDWRMKRDNVYEFFRRLGVFYVAESQQPYKLLKVVVDADYDMDRQTDKIAMPEIPLKIVETPFRKSLHTSMTIENEGMQFNDKWAYGMGTWFAENYWQYAFTGEDPTFYNAGTEAIKLIKQKESEITLTINTVPTNGLIDIDDGTTTFKLWRDDFAVGDVLKIKGHRVTLNGQNVLGDSNAEFLTVKTGWNYWDIRGIPNHNFTFEIDLRYLYD